MWVGYELLSSLSALASTRRTNLWMGLWSCDLEEWIKSWTLRTRPSSDGNTLVTRARGHWFLGIFSPLTSTTSFTRKLRFLAVHFCLSCRLVRYSFLQRVQNSFARCCTWRHLLLQYRSSRWKTPGGGSTILVFIVRMWFGVIGGLVGSDKFSTVSGLEWTISSASIIKFWTIHHWVCKNVRSTLQTKCS